MKPERQQGDAAALAKALLLDVLPGLFTIDPTVALNVPRDWTKADAPHIGVFDDGGVSDEWPVATATTLRVTVWSDGRGTSRAIAGRCGGILYARRVSGLWIGKPSSILDAIDSNNGGIMASITLPTKVRTLAV